MAITTYTFNVYNGSYSYDKWDVIQGATAGDARFFYSTVGANAGNYPLSRFIYTATQTTRMSDEVMRVSFTQTGTATFRQGSMVEVRNISPDSSANYTGTALGGGNGYVDFLCAGLTSTNAVSAGQVIAPIHPNWTTGFGWVPGYSTTVANKQLVIRSDLGDGYSQRMNTAINSNALGWSLIFDNRPNKETRAIANFLQDKCGVVPFVINFPIGNLFNANTLKYVNGEPKITVDSYGINTLTVDVQQVFDLG
jgi:phage-related protein